MLVRGDWLSRQILFPDCVARIAGVGLWQYRSVLIWIDRVQCQLGLSRCLLRGADGQVLLLVRRALDLSAANVMTNEMI